MLEKREQFVYVSYSGIKFCEYVLPLIVILEMYASLHLDMYCKSYARKNERESAANEI